MRRKNRFIALLIAAHPGLTTATLRHKPYPYVEPPPIGSRFLVPPTFCDLRGEDTLGLKNSTHDQGSMRGHGGPACKFLPFREYNHSKMPFSLIYRHLPKGGSSTMGHLLGEAWSDIWSHEHGRSAPKLQIQRVINCADKQLESARKAGHVLEFAVAREPLSRFASGYFYTGANFLVDEKGNRKIPEKDGGRERLVEYLASLPDGCNNGHLFPEYFYFCSCGKLKGGKGQAPLPPQGLPCARSLRFVLRLESIHTDWYEFIHVAARGLVKRRGPPPQVNVGKHRPSSASSSGFDALHVTNADLPDITAPLCSYLSNDYNILENLYSPLTECYYPWAKSPASKQNITAIQPPESNDKQYSTDLPTTQKPPALGSLYLSRSIIEVPVGKGMLAGASLVESKQEGVAESEDETGKRNAMKNSLAKLGLSLTDITKPAQH